ncbi:glyoxalase superfamily protein [Polaromonas sp.]|uniref:glyoxalase superfamily protein n=1 Tax=Polaromonas sp. TaxID=1869339 RepID=UPI0025FABC33|nr:glyoxalase superfamily protein [Polaromonas sp.]
MSLSTPSPPSHRSPFHEFGKTTPILRIFDEAKAREFYVGFLGFKVDWEHRFGEGMPLYLQVSKDGCVIHLSEHHGDCSPGAAMRIETDELDALQAELSARQYAYSKPHIEDTPWGSRDMSIKDPFGNRLTFTSAIST